MRKLLLATTALFGSVAFIGAAHASPAPTSPITLNVGGYVDFVAGFYNEAQGVNTESATTLAAHRANNDFETEFKINFDAMGKAANGMQYGANVSLWNGSDVTNQAAAASGSATNYSAYAGGSSTVALDSAYVWMSGAFGKLMMGDEHGASDLFVYAPTVGEGQIDGRYMDFTDPTTLARFQPSGIDNTEHSTKISYYTPKVGNDDNKVQLGVSYTPNMYNYGQDVTKFDTSGTLGNFNAVSPYQNIVEGDLAYTGNFRPVNIAATAQIISGSGNHGTPLASTLLYQNAPNPATLNNGAQDFTSWGIGTQVGFNGFTFGGSYVDEGSYGTIHGQDKAQDIMTLGAKYEFDKVGVAASWLTGQGYDNLLVGGATAATQSAIYTANYVKSFNAEGLGAAYTWFPGLTSNVDGVLFQQKDESIPQDHNDGYVLLLSQKMTF